MASYLARVELHNATYDDYEVLHAAMQRRGFSRTIASDEPRTYRLPTGTYVAENTSATLEHAYTAAEAAAREVRKTYWIIVVDWTSARFSLELGR
jgi:hypothetical protein